jgi:membrane-associated PAP2 superfamily phosphatase
MSRNGLIAALVLAAVSGLVFGIFPELDLAIADLFRNAAGQFSAREASFLSQLRSKSMWVVGVLAAPAFIAVIGKLILPRRRMLIPGNAALFLIATLALAPGLIVNGVLKEHSGRPRPIQVEELGGPQDFKAWYDFSGTCPQNCSFVSGEASGGYWTIAPAALAPPQWRAVAYGAAIAYGTAVGLLRMAFGGHFASDVIFAGVVTFLIIWVTYALIYRWPRTRPPEGAVEAWLGWAGLRLRGQRPVNDPGRSSNPAPAEPPP